jgi:hypothetical protein
MAVAMAVVLAREAWVKEGRRGTVTVEIVTGTREACRSMTADHHRMLDQVRYPFYL